MAVERVYAQDIIASVEVEHGLAGLVLSLVAYGYVAGAHIGFFSGRVRDFHCLAECVVVVQLAYGEIIVQSGYDVELMSGTVVLVVLHVVCGVALSGISEMRHAHSEACFEHFGNNLVYGRVVI